MSDISAEQSKYLWLKSHSDYLVPITVKNLYEIARVFKLFDCTNNQPEGICTVSKDLTYAEVNEYKKIYGLDIVALTLQNLGSSDPNLFDKKEGFEVQFKLKSINGYRVDFPPVEVKVLEMKLMEGQMQKGIVFSDYNCKVACLDTIEFTLPAKTEIQVTFQIKKQVSKI